MTRRQNILSKFVLSLSLAAGLLAATASASAQTQLRVTIPFDFTADNVPLPAGAYTVTRSTQSPNFLYLSNVKTGETHPVVVRNDSSERNHGSARLTFRRQPGGIYLSQVWSQTSSMHSELVSHPKPSKEMAKASKPASTFDIATK